MSNKIDSLQHSILHWAKSRGILEKSDPKTQCLKTMSEVGELADNIAAGNPVEDDIGDIMVTLIILAEMMGTDIETCLGVAYGEISGRQGRMVNGTFVKDGDR